MRFEFLFMDVVYTSRKELSPHYVKSRHALGGSIASMANRRMFSLQIVDSDAFVELPVTAQNLYFHLAVRADDDGFIGNVRRIANMIGAGDYEIDSLIDKRFILTFPSGVIVIKHWRIHNYIQNDRYHPTKYTDEKNTLQIKDNLSYTECIQPVSKMETEVRLGKVRLVKKNTGAPKRARAVKKAPDFNPLGAEVLKAFEEVDAKNKTSYANKTQRGAADFLLQEHGLDKILKVIALLPKTNQLAYFPTITSPYDLKEKWTKLESAMVKKKGEGISKGRGVEL